VFDSIAPMTILGVLSLAIRDLHWPWEHHSGVDDNSIGLDRPTIAMALHDQG